MRPKLRLLLLILLGNVVFGVWETRAQVTTIQQIFTSPLDAVSYSPDGSMIAAGSRDGVIRLWDAASGASLGALYGHTGWVTRLAFTPDGARLLSGSSDFSVRLWDVGAQRLLQTFEQHTQSVTGVAFSASGLLMASGSLDGTIWLAEAATGNTLATFTNYGGPVWGIAFSPDGHVLASGSEDGTIWLWGLYDSSLNALRGHTGAVTALAFGADGTRLLSSSWDQTIRWWDVNTGAALVLEGHSAPVTSVAFGADEMEALSASLDGTLRLWSLTEGRPTSVIQSSGHALTSFALSGRQVAAGSTDGVLTVWDLSRREQAATIVQVPENAREETGDDSPTVFVAQTGSSVGAATLALPTVNIYSPIITFFLDGVSWAIDPWQTLVGHLEGTAWLDTAGNIALGGHSLYPDGTPGIFNGLYGVNIGDPVFLTAGGEERRYVVSQKFSVAFDDLRVVYPTASAQLTLITCDIPSYDEGVYWERLVVIAVPG